MILLEKLTTFTPLKIKPKYHEHSAFDLLTVRERRQEAKNRLALHLS